MVLSKQTDEENEAESGETFESRHYLYGSLGGVGRGLPLLALGMQSVVDDFSCEADEAWPGIRPGNSVADGM